MTPSDLARSIAAFVLVLGAAACGGREAQETTPLADASPLPDAAPVCALGAGAVVSDAAANGIVAFGLIGDPTSPSRFDESFIASFSLSPTTVSMSTCCREIGACHACPAGCEGTEPTEPATVSAGSLEILQPNSAPLYVPYDADAGGYSVPVGVAGARGIAFDGGALLCVSGSGGAAPSFPTLPIVAANALSITSPALTLTVGPDGGAPALRVSAASDLVVTWSSATAGAKVTLVFVNSQRASVSCSFDATSGGGTVPKEALATLPDEALGFFTWSQAESVTYSVAGYVIAVMSSAQPYEVIPARFE